MLPDHDRIPFTFQHDNAPSHSSRWTKTVLEEFGVPMHEHPGNSPDMNAIEQAWLLLQIKITNDWYRLYTLEWTARAWVSE
jgi:transposase